MANVGRAIKRTMFRLGDFFRRAAHKALVEPLCKSALAECGKGVRIGRRCCLDYGNVYVGNSVSINYGAHFLSSRARIVVGDHVMFGPKVTVVTGNHRTDIPGRFMDTVGDDEKLPENDQDVVFEGDNWIGAGSIILKGVTVGYGSIVAAGAVVSRDVPPYTVVGGVPARVLSRRFDDETVESLEASGGEGLLFRGRRGGARGDR